VEVAAHGSAGQEDGPRGNRPQLPGEAPDVGEMGLTEGLVQDVDPVRLREDAAQPGALPTPRGPKRKNDPRGGARIRG
jgi:hypothetical protein